MGIYQNHCLIPKTVFVVNAIMKASGFVANFLKKKSLLKIFFFHRCIVQYCADNNNRTVYCSQKVNDIIHQLQNDRWDDIFETFLSSVLTQSEEDGTDRRQCHSKGGAKGQLSQVPS